MTSRETLNQTITMLRRRILEIDRQIERLERQRNGLRLVSKSSQRCVPTRRTSGSSPQDPDLDRRIKA